MTTTSPVLAAGILAWKKINGTPHILLIHRHGHRDISFPKGKLDPGETLASTAVRELSEETGIDVSLGAPLAIAKYDLPGGKPKEVWYWAAELTPMALEQVNNFVPNDEVRSLSFVPLDEAHQMLSYRKDQQVLDVLETRILNGTAETFAVILERHAKAAAAGGWFGDDEERPLTEQGTADAHTQAQTLKRFGIHHIYTSPATRCLETIEPISANINTPGKTLDALSQYAHHHGEDTLNEKISTVLASKQTTLLCSHGPVIPNAMNALFEQTKTELTPELYRSAVLSTTEAIILHFTTQEPTALVAVEKYPVNAVRSTVSFGTPLE